MIEIKALLKCKSEWINQTFNLLLVNGRFPPGIIDEIMKNTICTDTFIQCYFVCQFKYPLSGCLLSRYATVL